jgi:hypothetical protein
MALLAAAFGLACAPATAPAPAAPAAATAADGPEGVRVTLTSVTPLVTDLDENVTVTGSIQNMGAAPVTGDINLRLATPAIASEADLEAWQSAGVEDYPAWRATSAKVTDPLAPSATLPFSLRISASDFPFDRTKGFEWGPWGILVDFETVTGSIGVARSFVVYAPPDLARPATSLSVALPLVARTGESDAAAAERALGLVLASAERPVDWVFDPALFAASGEGELAGAGARLAEAITAHAGTRSLFALPYGDPDVAQLAHAAKGAAPLLDLARSEARRATSEALGPALAAKVRDDLLWPVGRPSGQVVNLAAGTGKGLTVVADLPAPNAEGEWNVDRPAADPGAPDASPSPSATSLAGSTGGEASLTTWPQTIRLASDDARTAAIVPDSGLLDLISRPSSALTEAQTAQRVLASLAVRCAMSGEASGTAAGGGIALVLPRDSETAAERVGTILEQVFDQPWLAPRPLGTVLGEAPSWLVHANDAAAPKRGPSRADTDALGSLAARLVAFAAITSDPDGVIGGSAAPLLAPLRASLTPAAARDRLAAEAAAETEALLAEVAVVTGSEMNLISEAGLVPIVVRNDTSGPIHLTVGLVSRSPALVTDKTVPIDVEPNAQGTIRVPIRAIANGNIDVDVVLMNADGERIAAPASFRVRVRAEWENVGTGVFIALFALVFVVGLVRSIRRRRRRPAAGAAA